MEGSHRQVIKSHGESAGRELRADYSRSVEGCQMLIEHWRVDGEGIEVFFKKFKCHTNRQNVNMKEVEEHMELKQLTENKIDMSRLIS